MKLSELVPKPKVGLGIDIQGRLLCHVLLSKAFGGIQLLHWGIEELPTEAIDRSEVLKEKLAGLLGRLPKRPAFITVGLPRRLVTMRSVSMPAVGEEELRGILDYEVERHIPFPVEEIQYDFQVLERDAEKATVLLTAARKEEIGQYLALLQEAGITPTALGVSTCASFNALLYNQDQDAEPLSALIDLHDGEAELGLAKQGIFRYSRYLTMGSDIPLDLLVPEISALFAHIGANGGQHQGRISVAGAGAGRGDLLRHLAERTGLEVEFLQPFRRIKAKDIDPQTAHSLGVAVGLALNGLTALSLGINLLPKELAPPRRDGGLVMAFQLLTLIAALGLIYLVTSALRERQVLTELTGALNQVQAEAAKVESLKGEVGALANRITTLEKIDRDEIRKLDVLKELIAVLPKGVTLTLFSVDGLEMRLGGSISGSASDIISALEQSPIFENVGFTSPVASRGTESQEFQIKALLEAGKEKPS